jgi:hypothetical protein
MADPAAIICKNSVCFSEENESTAKHKLTLKAFIHILLAKETTLPCLSGKCIKLPLVSIKL